MTVQSRSSELSRRQQDWQPRFSRALQGMQERNRHAELRLGLLDPSLVLQRGYAWLTLEDGQTLSRVSQAAAGQRVRASLTDGAVDMVVTDPCPN